MRYRIISYIKISKTEYNKMLRTVITIIILLASFINNLVYAKFDFKEYKEKPDVLIVAGPHYSKIVNSIESNLPSKKYNVTVKYINKQQIISNIDEDIDFIISVGRESTLKTNEYLSNIEHTVPQLSVLIPHRMYNSINRNLQFNKDKNRKITAIFREQPVDRQLKVIQNLLPEAKTIGVLTSMYDKTSIDELKEAAVNSKFNIVITENYKRESLIDSLRYVLSNCDVLLTLPDPEIYNPYTAKGILVTSFRRGIPIIGYSKTYVDAGAVAAVYTKANLIAEQAADVTNKYFLSKTLMPPSYPKEYAIAKNDTILKNLRNKKKQENNKIKIIK